MALDNTKTITGVTYNGDEFPIAGGGVPSGYSAIAVGTFTPTTDVKTFTATHNMGVEPDVVFIYIDLDAVFDVKDKPYTIYQGIAYNKIIKVAGDNITQTMSMPLVGTYMRDSTVSYIVLNSYHALLCTLTDFTLTIPNNPNVYLAAGRQYKWIAAKYATE